MLQLENLIKHALLARAQQQQAWARAQQQAQRVQAWAQQRQAQQQAQAQQQQQQTQQHHHHHQNQQLQHQNQQQAQAQQQQNQEEEDIEEDRVSQDGNTSNSNTASEYEHRSEFSSEQSSDSEILEEEEVTEPPQKRQRKDSRTLNTIMLGGTASTPGQPLGTPTAMQHGAAATALTQRVGAAGGPTAPTQFSAETLEDVKKCKNFLSTLIRIVSNGKHSSETTATVKDLVKNLLDAKIEAEEFSSRLARELNSSPQPYLVPFLKEILEDVKKCKNFLLRMIRLASDASHETTAIVKDLVKNLLDAKIEAEEFSSRLDRELNLSPQPYLVPFLKRILPALRLLTPDSSAFIQQSRLPLTTQEILEDVKKCKNFLLRMIRLASDASHETTAIVKDLVKNLLDAKIEAEEFSSRLDRELNISIHPSFLPFFKRNLPVLRLLTPDSSAFIHETLKHEVENCKNFLSTVIRLASNRKHSSETTANVKELVKNLLDAKIEAEDFSSRLGLELNIQLSPSHLHLFKRILPALRLLTPDSSAFIQQSELPQFPPPTPQRQPPPPTSGLLEEVKKQLANSEEHLRAKDKELEETKAEKTKQERHLGLKLKEVKKQLADSEEHLRAKVKELEETKAEKTKQERHLGLEEQAQQTQEEMKAELQCSVCAGLFIEPVILNCAHSFCTYCIRKCREVKNECPLCREPVQYQTRNLVMEKCMERIVQRLSPDEKAMRHREITERANQDETRETPDPMEVSPAQDMLSPSQDVLYLHASIISPIDGVYSNSPGSPYVNSPAYSNMPTPQSVSSTASENEEPSRSWRP